MNGRMNEWMSEWVMAERTNERIRHDYYIISIHELLPLKETHYSSHFRLEFPKVLSRHKNLESTSPPR